MYRDITYWNNITIYIQQPTNFAHTYTYKVEVLKKFLVQNVYRVPKYTNVFLLKWHIWMNWHITAGILVRIAQT